MGIQLLEYLPDWTCMVPWVQSAVICLERNLSIKRLPKLKVFLHICWHNYSPGTQRRQISAARIQCSTSWTPLRSFGIPLYILCVPRQHSPESRRLLSTCPFPTRGIPPFRGNGGSLGEETHSHHTSLRSSRSSRLTGSPNLSGGLGSRLGRWVAIFSISGVPLTAGSSGGSSGGSFGGTSSVSRSWSSICCTSAR